MNLNRTVLAPVVQTLDSAIQRLNNRSLFYLQNQRAVEFQKPSSGRIGFWHLPVELRV